MRSKLILGVIMLALGSLSAPALSQGNSQSKSQKAAKPHAVGKEHARHAKEKSKFMHRAADEDRREPRRDGADDIEEQRLEIAEEEREREQERAERRRELAEDERERKEEIAERQRELAEEEREREEERAERRRELAEEEREREEERAERRRELDEEDDDEIDYIDDDDDDDHPRLSKEEKQRLKAERKAGKQSSGNETANEMRARRDERKAIQEEYRSSRTPGQERADASAIAESDDPGDAAAKKPKKPWWKFWGD